jgi:hypothetical protein
MSQSARSLSATARPATASAWIVVVVMTALVVVVLLGLSFSGRNTPASIDGTTATTSQSVDGG